MKSDSPGCGKKNAQRWSAVRGPVEVQYTKNHNKNRVNKHRAKNH